MKRKINNIRYFNFPIKLLEEVLVNLPKGKNNNKYYYKDVLKNVILDFAIGELLVNEHKLNKLLENAELKQAWDNCDVDYYEKEYGTDIFTKCETFFRLLAIFDLSLRDEQDVYSTWKNMKETYCWYKDEKVITGINKDVLFAFLNEDKDINEVRELLCFLAVKSIAQGKKSVKTNYIKVLSRMCGRNKDLTKTGLQKPRKEIQRLITSHYKELRNLLKNVENNYHIGFYTPKGVRGFYLSTTLNTLKLVEYICAKKYKDVVKKNEIKKIEEKYKNYPRNLNEGFDNKVPHRY